jgi:hypothetical protein
MAWLNANGSEAMAVRYDHLATGELKSIREEDPATGLPVQSGPGVLATYGYDTLGRRKSLTRGNGTTTAYDYNARRSCRSLRSPSPIRRRT